MSDPGQSLDLTSRLNGWKEVATHLGKGVRTVQRWEKLYGLPVHRLGGAGGEIVFAYRHELDAWLVVSEQARASDARARTALADTEPAQPAGEPRRAASNTPQPAPPTVPAWAQGPPSLLRPRWRTLPATALALLAVVLSALGWMSLTRADPRTAAPQGHGMLANWRFEGHRLQVLDAEGRVAWTYPVDPTVAPGWVQTARPGWLAPVAIVDLDGDGPREVLLSVPHSWPRGRWLVCLNSDGTTRWTREPDDRQRFGDEWFSGPWHAGDFRVSARPDGTSVVWATFHHHLLFPSVLEQIAPDGRVLSRYWSNGYVDSLSEATWQGREVLLVGAANNEHKGAALAILSRDHASGTAPAANPAYRCETCPPGGPTAFVVFPPTPVGLVRGETSSLRLAWVNADGEIVAASDDTAPGFGDPGTVYFTLDGFLRPRRIEVAASYSRLHDQLFEAGRLDRRYSRAEERRLVPLLRWDGSRFVEAPLVR